MSIYSDIIDLTTNFVVDNTSSKTEDEVEILKYGIEVIFMNISKLLVIYIIAFLSGYLLESLFVTIIFGFIRSFSSGLHVKGFFKCLIFSALIFIFIIFAKPFFDLQLSIKLIIAILVLIGIYIYSPADTEEKPYLDKDNRKKLKISALILSSIYLVIWITSALGDYSNYFITTLIVQLVLISPVTYKILGRRYKNYLYEDEYI